MECYLEASASLHKGFFRIPFVKFTYSIVSKFKISQNQKNVYYIHFLYALKLLISGGFVSWSPILDFAFSEELFSIPRILTIGAGSAKRNDGPQCPPQANFLGDLGCVLYKKHEPPRGSAPAAGGKFWAFGGRCTQKSRCWDAFRNVFLAQNTPKILKNFRLRRAKSPNVRV